MSYLLVAHGTFVDVLGPGGHGGWRPGDSVVLAAAGDGAVGRQPIQARPGTAARVIRRRRTFVR